MQIFEFHFNPKTKIPTHYPFSHGIPDLIFDSFCFEPENVYEKRLGSLYVVGELKSVLPQNLKFLDNFSIFLKKQYYSFPIKFSPETSLKEGLKKSNEFLEQIAKSGDVSWLGNLNVAILNLVPQQKNQWGINLTKVGTVKILLLRGGRMIDIGKNLEFSEIEPYPLKLFSNIISGKLVEGDIIMVLTEGVFSFFAANPNLSQTSQQKINKNKKFFQSGSLIDKMAGMRIFSPSMTEPKKLIIERKLIERQLKEILNNREKELLKISGICLLCVLTQPLWQKDEKPKTLTFQKDVEKLSIGQVFLPLTKRVKKLGLIFLKNFTKIKEWEYFSKKKLPAIKIRGVKLKKLKIKVPKIKFSICLKKPKIKFPNNFKKNLILVASLVLLLTLGFLIANKEKEQQLKNYQNTLNGIQEKTLRAESFLILNKKNEANLLFKEAWQETLTLTKKDTLLPPEFKKEVFSLKSLIENNLYQLNKLKIIEEPNLFFEFNVNEFVPQKIVARGQNFYFYSPYSQNLYKLTREGKGFLIENPSKFNLAFPLEDSVLFFLKPNNLIVFKDEKFDQPLSLPEPYQDFSFDAFSSYQSALYFLDRKNGEIIKYPYLEHLKWGHPQLWLAAKNTEAKSLAVDGSVWILNKNNTISKYIAGRLKENLKLDLFPFSKDFSKIFTSFFLNHLYILEPGQNRIIILNKTGEIFQQIQSENFDNLLDFVISEDEKTIWLLNGLKVYQIEF